MPSDDSVVFRELSFRFDSASDPLLADLNILDPARVAPAVPEIVMDLPGGGPRLSQHAEGITATLVAGQVTLRDGEPTGALPGRLLRNPHARR